MSLRPALTKLQDARSAYQDLDAASDADSFRRAFVSCITSLATAAERIGSGAKSHLRSAADRERTREFETFWKEEYEKPRDKDPLVKWMIDVRNNETHTPKGMAPLSHSAAGTSFRIGNLPPDTTFLMGSDGAWIAQNIGTAREVRVPAESGKYGVTEADYKVWAGPTNPPTMHRGHPISNTDVPSLLAELIRYVEDLYDRSQAFLNLAPNDHGP